jgi:tetratricopeptide (TPR) repeat protein
MEILSTGEKIKRARIYKGYTLKKLCGDKISLSKMSCIENNKIKPEEWILNFISEKLQIDASYLKQDAREQIIKNIEELQKRGCSPEYEEDLQYNLKFAEEYSYTDICFTILHLIFNYYIKQNKLEKIQNMLSKYYDYWQKSYSHEKSIIYHMDIADFFYTSEEFIQAINYYDNVKSISQKIEDYTSLAKATYNEAKCHLKLKSYEKAYNMAVELVYLIDNIESDIKKAQAYHIMAILCLRNNFEEFEKYEKKSLELYKDDLEHKAQSMYNYAVEMFNIGLKDKAIEYINTAVNLHPKDDKEKYVDFILRNVNQFIRNGIVNKAKKICDRALNYAITLDNMIFIEKAYYYKALILEKEKSFNLVEVYMNLSLDTLLKFAKNGQIYERYMEMGYMYYRIGNTAESIKYFNFAIQLEKKM